MNQRHFISNAVLWAAAIVASAIVRAPTFFTTVLLPVLAATALVVTWPKSRAAGYNA
jgi:hypothetical protein